MSDPYSPPNLQPDASAPKRSSSSSSAGKRPQSHPSQPRIRRRNRLITSCLECRRRKLKCDKAQPCGNCTKFARDCVFLAPALDPAAQMRLAEIKEKMGSLERTLEDDVARRSHGSGSGSQASPAERFLGYEGDSTDELDAPEDERDLEPTPFATIDAAYADDADDDLMDLGVQLGKMRITERIGGFVRPKMAEEFEKAVKELDEELPLQSSTRHRSSLTSSSPFLLPGREYMAPSSSFFFAPHPAKGTLMHFLPSRTVADRLMEQYWSCVHVVARTLHRPSFERHYGQFWKEISMGSEPRVSFQAVVLAALFSAVISIPEEQVLSEYGVSKAELVENFKQGTESALSRANFLRTTKVEVLQAFVMYMIPLCRSEVSRGHSALTGTAIRLAECMGLHRDGSFYGLSAVDTHVRRLIWYQLCFLDIRTCEATGPRPQIRREDFDTKFPLNVDDEDLESPYPPTVDASRWTDMTLTRMRFECNEMQRMVWVERPRIERKRSTLTSLLGKIQQFWNQMEFKYLPLMDGKNPLHAYATHVYGVLSRRMHIMALFRYCSTQTKAMPERLRQILMSSATLSLEHAIAIETTPSLRPWAWYAGAYQQYHAALLVMGELYAKGDPSPREEARIWRSLDYAFELPPDMTPLEKARYVLAELRDRTLVYQSLRKVRAPARMESSSPWAASSSSAPPFTGYPGASSVSRAAVTGAIAGAGVLPPTEFKFSEFSGTADGEAFFAPPVQASPPPFGASSDTSSSIARDVGPGSRNSPRDVMLDIDWNEWDKLFPRGASDDFSIPPFSFSSTERDTLNW